MKDLRPTLKNGVVIRDGTVKRRTANAFDHRGRRLVIALEPGDVIAIREEKCRTWFRAPISRVFLQIVKWTVETEKANRKRNQT